MTDLELTKELNQYILRNATPRNSTVAEFYVIEDFHILQTIKIYLENNNFQSINRLTMLNIVQHIKSKIEFIENGTKGKDNAKLHIPLIIKCLSMITITPGYKYHPILPGYMYDSDFDVIPALDEPIHETLLMSDNLNKKYKPPEIDKYNKCAEILRSNKFEKYNIIFLSVITNNLKQYYETEKLADEIHANSRNLTKNLSAILIYLME